MGDVFVSECLVKWISIFLNRRLNEKSEFEDQLVNILHEFLIVTQIKTSVNVSYVYLSTRKQLSRRFRQCSVPVYN